jgi:uncharacterized GH25 family protein
MGFTSWMQTSSACVHDWDFVPTSVIFGERSEKSSAEDVHLTPSQKLGVIHLQLMAIQLQPWTSS